MSVGERRPCPTCGYPDVTDEEVEDVYGKLHKINEILGRIIVRARSRIQDPLTMSDVNEAVRVIVAGCHRG